MIYQVQLSNGQQHKRHENQIRPRYVCDNESTDLDSLPDLTSNINSKSNVVTDSHSSTRYPRRTRKAPVCFSPS